MKKPLIVYVTKGIVVGYKLPKSTEILVVDLDQAKKQGEEVQASRWMKKVSSGIEKYAANLLVGPVRSQCWYRA